MYHHVASKLIANDVVKVDFVGDIDFHMAPAMDNISQEVKDFNPELVIFDLEKITWLSSTCIGKIIGMLKFCRNTGSAFALVNVDYDIERKIKAYGLIDTLILFESTDKALEAYGKSRL